MKQTLKHEITVKSHSIPSKFNEMPSKSPVNHHEITIKSFPFSTPRRAAVLPYAQTLDFFLETHAAYSAAYPCRGLR